MTVTTDSCKLGYLPVHSVPDLEVWDIGIIGGFAADKRPQEPVTSSTKANRGGCYLLCQIR